MRHHAGNAFRALTDTIEFARAVQLAKDKTNPRNTLIIVTADHSHVFTIAGYPKRGNPILGKVVEPDKTDLAHDQLGLPYTTLSYANGPGYTGESHDAMRQAMIPSGPKSFPHQPDRFSGITIGRSDLTIVDTTNPQYLQEATVPMPMETPWRRRRRDFRHWPPSAFVPRGTRTKCHCPRHDEGPSPSAPAISVDSRFVHYPAIATVDFYSVATLTKKKSLIYRSYIASSSTHWYFTHTHSFTAQDFPT